MLLICIDDPPSQRRFKYFQNNPFSVDCYFKIYSWSKCTWFSFVLDNQGANFEEKSSVLIDVSPQLSEGMDDSEIAFY